VADAGRIGWNRSEMVRIVLPMAVMVGKFIDLLLMSLLLPLLESSLARICVENRAGCSFCKSVLFDDNEEGGAKLCTEHEF